jgi:transcriptional regulator with GAF, ATPase, and Fis domain
VLFADGSELPLQWLQLHPERLVARGDDGSMRNSTDIPAPQGDGQSVRLPLDGSMGLDEMDRFIICAALERNQYNVTTTAQMLNTTRDTLRYRIRKYAINLPEND